MVIAATIRQIETAIVMANIEIHILRSPSRTSNQLNETAPTAVETPSASRKPWTATPSVSRSDSVVKRLGDALLDGLGGFGGHLPSERPKLLILRGDQVELLTRLLGTLCDGVSIMIRLRLCPS